MKQLYCTSCCGHHFHPPEWIGELLFGVLIAIVATLVIWLSWWLLYSIKYSSISGVYDVKRKDGKAPDFKRMQLQHIHGNQIMISGKTRLLDGVEQEKENFFEGTLRMDRFNINSGKGHYSHHRAGVQLWGKHEITMNNNQIFLDAIFEEDKIMKINSYLLTKSK